MKRRLLFIAALCSLLLVFTACDAREAGSIKTFTRPYIAQYACTEAYFGEENLLDRFDYIKIVLVDKEQMQLIYKTKHGEQSKLESTYLFDLKSRELTAEIGILGYRFKQSAVVENGQFTITKTFGRKQLVMKFQAE